MPRPNITRFANLAIDPSLDPGNPYKTFRIPCLDQEEIDAIPESGLIDGIIIYNCTSGDAQTYNTVSQKWQQAIASDTTGLQIPNLTTEQRNAISNPLNGTFIFHTDSNDLEVYDNGQWYDVLDRSIATVRPGAIMMWGGENAPTDWRECDGSLLNRADFTALFDAIGTNWGHGDGSTTFNIPDLRGLFVRGWDHGNSKDPGRNARTAIAPGGATGDAVGSAQSDSVEIHTHELSSQNLTADRDIKGNAGDSNNDYHSFTTETINPNALSIGAANSETRPKNAYVMYIIKVV